MTNRAYLLIEMANQSDAELQTIVGVVGGALTLCERVSDGVLKGAAVAVGATAEEVNALLSGTPPVDDGRYRELIEPFIGQGPATEYSRHETALRYIREGIARERRTNGSGEATTTGQGREASRQAITR